MTPLRHRMIGDMAIRNLADNTQSAYLQQITAYAEHFHRSPEDLGPEAIRTYQLYLTQTRMLSPSSVSVATGALRFLYKVTLKRDWSVEEIPMPKRSFILPVILSREHSASSFRKWTFTGRTRVPLRIRQDLHFCRGTLCVECCAKQY